MNRAKLFVRSGAPLRTLAAAAALMLLPSLVSAQVVRGTILEWDSDKPINNAVVVLLDEDGDTTAAVRTGPSPRVYVDDVLVYDPRWLTGPLEEVVRPADIRAIEPGRSAATTALNIDIRSRRSGGSHV